MNARSTASAAIALVVCALVAGCGSGSITSSSNEAPILSPQNLVVSQNAYGEVQLTWAQNGQSILQGYKVYRLDVAASMIETLTPSPISETYFKDSGAVWTKDYEYRVTSVSTKGNESVPATALIEVTAPAPGDKRHPKRRPR